MSRQPQLPEGEYFVYLRKSRADIDAEARGEGETLAKHKKAIMRLARDYKLNITRMFEEIVSGESLMARPQMLELLRLSENERPKGVLVMDMDRLGRGNMQEQGLILDTFRRLNILIITPRKVYDLNNEFDEEYSEFEAFMARKEFKIIKRRLRSGVERSVQEGNYVGTRPPYGYLIHFTDRGERTLKPHPEQSDVIRMIFSLYTDGKDGQEMGAKKIAKYLDELGVPTYRQSTKWNSNVILQILRNPVYIGRIQWKKIEQTKNADGSKDYRKRSEDQIIDVEGKHEPIVDNEVFDKAKEKLTDNFVPHLTGNLKLANPLAGLIKCDMCGKNMVMKTHRNRNFETMICKNDFCECRSARFDLIEGKILYALEEWLKGYKHTWGTRKKKESSAKQVKEQAVKNIEHELEEKQKQKGNLHNLVERGIYDDETFLTRSKELAEEIKLLNEKMENAKKELAEEIYREKAQKDFIPKFQSVIKSYKSSKEVAHKNQLIKSILKEVRYRKTKEQLGDDFEISLVPKIPRS